MSKIKVLTVQFDVTHLPTHAIEALRLAAEVQSENIITETKHYDNAEEETFSADVLNSGVREVDVDDL